MSPAGVRATTLPHAALSPGRASEAGSQTSISGARLNHEWIEKFNAVKQLWQMRACFICEGRGLCNHRELEVAFAELDRTRRGAQ